MTPSERTHLRISLEIARWVVSSVIGLCGAFWVMVVSVIISPATLDAPFRHMLSLFALWSTLFALVWYAFVAQHWTLEQRPPR